MKQGYTDEERGLLHSALREILSEIARVCDEAGIRYFLCGGSMIGCHFFNDIDPFDDDVDLGMTRDNYERFLREAPAKLRPEYALQWFGNTPQTPFYFAKVRKRGTLFVEESTRNINMQQGIYIDIFPFDKIPDAQKPQRRQRKMANIINSCFVSKSVWRYKYCGRCELQEPLRHSFLNCLFDRVVVTVVPKRALFWLLRRVQTWYNGCETAYCNIVLTDVDQIRVANVADLQPAAFGGMTVFMPRNYEEYLHHHYPNLRKYLPKEEVERNSHRPVTLQFKREEKA